MNLHRAIPSSIRGLRPEAGFTMIEIAISLGVIAFAIIAIIGILPTGLQGQRDNREETIINHDARLLIEAIKSGGRDRASDLGSYVVATNGVNVEGNIPRGIDITNLVQLLSDTKTNNTIVMSAISGAVVTRRDDLAFRYEVRQTVVNAPEFQGTPVEEQVHELRLRFAWPVLPDNTVNFNGEPNRRIVRALLSGWWTNEVIYAQQYYQP